MGYRQLLGQRGRINHADGVKPADFLNRRVDFLDSAEEDAFEGSAAAKLAQWTKATALSTRLTAALCARATSGSQGATEADLLLRQTLNGRLARQVIAHAQHTGKSLPALHLPVYLVQPEAPVAHQLYMSLQPHADATWVLQIHDDKVVGDAHLTAASHGRPRACGIAMALRAEDLAQPRVCAAFDAVTASPQLDGAALRQAMVALREALVWRRVPACCTPIWTCSQVSDTCAYKNHNRVLKASLAHAWPAPEVAGVWRAFKAAERAFAGASTTSIS